MLPAAKWSATSWRRGLAIAAAGVAAVFWSESLESPLPGRDRVTLTGDLILLASAVLLAIKIVYIKQSVRLVEPAKLIFWHNVVALVCFTAFSLAWEDFTPSRLTWPAFWGAVYQGVFVAGLCFAIQATLLRHHSASQVSVFGFATPLFGALGVLMRGDRLSWSLLVAAVCVAIGILLVHATGRADA